jgi:UDP:flavonoid glycosyltransferase YjiC (YdhE family)
MKRIFFYISGHGFGHAARSAEVIRALGEEHPGIDVLVATSAPKRLFADLPAVVGNVTASEIDTGVVEGGSSLSIDRHATVARLADFMRDCDEVVAVEADRVRREKISLIVADIPYLAGEIAERAGVPSIAIGNFTWDWIYEPYLDESPDGQALLARIRRAYGKMSCYLRLPFSHDTDLFNRVIDIPLITRSVRTAPEDVLHWLGIVQDDRRSRVLYAMRDSAFLHSLARAADKSPDRLFFYFGSPQSNMPENVRAVALDDRVAFPDVLNACDVIVSKMGYGTLADCLSTGTPILFPPRSDFREDEAFAPVVPRRLRAHEMSLDDFEAGNWLPHFKQLEGSPEPSESLPMDGAAACARIVASMC